MSNTREFDDASFENFLDSVPEVEPPARLKDAVFERLERTPQEPTTVVAGGGNDTGSGDGGVIDLGARRRRPWFAVVAAALVLVIGGVTVAQFLPAGEDTQLAQDAPAPESPGEKEMHAIMGAEDLRSADAEAEGARLQIVSSEDMGKAGAMVDGEPELDAGMGAQVWAVSSTGEMSSAGVIGQDPHDGVWMPFDGDVTKVLVTEEPMAGSAEPSGRMLASVTLNA
ncbi:anti-sigma factor [Corynebacterium phoceense]|uniref:anti-sigma factor n=1 Tax=Corynebacterium phoceense TaxID=1686286 RepID=UPI000839C9C1|nr:anti-sigma factor [Corynebacterium phoceense]